MAEGDTIHRTADRLATALAGREVELADTSDPRSPIHGRAGELVGRTLELAEARGKHLLLHFSGSVALHSHLGMNGAWQVRRDGRLPTRRSWVVLSCGPAVAAQFGGRLLRLVGESRLRNDPGLAQLGPDPLRPEFDLALAARRLLSMGAGREVGDVLLDQSAIAGIGNVIKCEACFAAGIDPWRRTEDLEVEEAERLLAANQRIMRGCVRSGRRPHNVYRATRRPCRRCGGRITVAGQGDANRSTYWCERCQT